MNQKNNFTARMSYDIAKQRLYDAWIVSFGGDAAQCSAYVNSRKLSVGYVRLEVELSTTNTQFQFGVTQNQQNSNNVQFPTEYRLNQQDSLVVSEYGFYVGLPTSQADVNWYERTYGNIVDFTAAAAKAIDATLFGKGRFKCTVNNDVVIPGRDMFAHLYRPETQQTAALGVGSPNDQICGAEDGSVTMEPNLVLIGSKNSEPVVIIPKNLAAVDNFTRLVWLPRGVLAQNSTVIN